MSLMNECICDTDLKIVSFKSLYFVERKTQTETHLITNTISPILTLLGVMSHWKNYLIKYEQGHQIKYFWGWGYSYIEQFLGSKCKLNQLLAD